MAVMSFCSCCGRRRVFGFSSADVESKNVYGVGCVVHTLVL